MSRGFVKVLTSQRAKKVYLVLSLLVILLLVCDNIFMPWLVTSGGIVKVPSVLGLKFDRARIVLDSANLQVRKADVRPDSRHPEGTVIGQVPSSGAQVRTGRRVYLTISGGEPIVQVPSLKGRSLRDAKFTLERAGLILGGSSYEPSSGFPPGTIIDQGVAAGMKIRKGTVVSVVISQGKETDRISVPTLVGKILPEAEKLLTQRGLKVGNITYQENLELLPNTILEQYPRGGELVGLGQPVDLFVVQTGGKKPKEVMEN